MNGRLASIDGPLEIGSENGRIRGSAELSIRSLVVGDPAAPTWNEPLVRLTARGRFDPAADLAVFDELRVESMALGCAASGRIAKLSTAGDLMLTGTLVYDLERWEPQFRRLRPWAPGAKRGQGRRAVGWRSRGR